MLQNKLPRFVLAVCLFALVQCSVKQQPPKEAPPATPIPGPALPVNALLLPLVTQETGYSCGVASLLSVLNYWGIFPGSESDLYKELGTTPEGTDGDKIIEFAKARGLAAREDKNLSLSDLQKALAVGETAILSIQAWSELEGQIDWKKATAEGHYVVLVGVDGHFLYAMDPMIEGTYGYLPLGEFDDRWHDGGDYHSAILIKGSGAPSSAKTILDFSENPLTRIE